MGELASEGAKLAKAAKPDDKAVKAVLKKIEANCAACHKVFRDAN
jgi:cytochrome c556